MKTLWSILSVLTFVLGAIPGFAQHDHQPGDPVDPGELPEGEVLVIPPTDENLVTFDLRQYQQELSLWRFDVFHDFRFTNKVAESGIDFLHQIVDDCGKFSKAVHYDHGNGMAAADVDGDDRVDIYFISQLGGNQLWKNLGGGKFRNITEESGTGMPESVSVGASFADTDNDGDVDLYVATVRTGNTLFANDGTGHFENITTQAGLAYSGHSSGSTFFDYDRDGLVDLFVNNIGKYTTEVQGRGGYWVGVTNGFQSHLFPERREDSLLYHNLGGNRFEDVTTAMGVGDNGFDGDASFHDVNRDGYPDLYVLCMQGDNHYYENDRGRRFIDRTAEVFPKTSWGAMGIKFLDWDNDGQGDLYISDMHSDMGRGVPPAYEKMKSLVPWGDDFTQGSANNIFGNSFFCKVGTREQEEISDKIGVENYWPWGVSAGDVNADGWEDLFVTSGMNYPFRYTANYLMLNNAGKEYLDSEYITGLEPREVFTSPWFELDCSGADAEHPRCVGLSGHKTVFAAAGSKSSVIFDVDGDGDLDIVTLEFNDYPQVWINDLNTRKTVNFVQIKLIGVSSNRSGLGARVTVTTALGSPSNNGNNGNKGNNGKGNNGNNGKGKGNNGRSVRPEVVPGVSYTKWQDGKSGYLGQSDLPLYFGLDDNPNIHSIEVLWPSGKRQVIRNSLRSGRLIKIEEN